MPSLKEQIAAALSKITMPGTGKDIVAAGAVSDIYEKDGKVMLSISVPSDKASRFEPIRAAAEAAVKSVPGVVKATVALIEPRALDCDLLIFVEVLLDRTTDDVFRAFADHVRSIPEILECHMVAGGFDYLVKARVSDMASLWLASIYRFRNLVYHSLIE